MALGMYKNGVEINRYSTRYFEIIIAGCANSKWKSQNIRGDEMRLLLHMALSLILLFAASLSFADENSKVVDVEQVSVVAEQTPVVTEPDPVVAVAPCKECPPCEEPKPCPPCKECPACQECLPCKECPPSEAPKPCPPCEELKPCPPCEELKPCPPCEELKPCPPCEKCIPPIVLESTSILLSEGKAESSAKHLQYLKSTVETIIAEKQDDEHLMAGILSDIDDYLLVYRDVPGAEEALALKAVLYGRDKNFIGQMICLSKLIYSYPKSSFRDKAAIGLRGLAMGKLKKEMADKLVMIEGPKSGTWGDRYFEVISYWNAFSVKEINPFRLVEIDEFLMRYPNHDKADDIIMMKAGIFIKDDKIESAAYNLARLAELYPASELRAQALFKLANIYENDLKVAEKAVKAYDAICKEHPDSPEVLKSYQNAALLYDKKLKDSDKAVASLEMIVTKYPADNAAKDALKYMADIYSAKDKYDDVIKSYQRLADLFKGDDAVAALVKAADIAKKSKNDPVLQIEIQERIRREYPVTEAAVEALFDIADTYEKTIKDSAKAIETFKIIINEYPGHKLANDAQKRKDKLTGVK